MATAAQEQAALVLTEPKPRALTTSEQFAELQRQGASLEALQKFMDLRDREEARQAKLAFVEAKARFAAEEINITKDKTNKQYDSKYTSIGNLVNTVRPFLGKHGFDVRWEVDQAHAPTIHVTCVLTHDMGHSERVSMTVPPDTSGQKNPIQQIKSAITYARNLTFEAVCGLASTDGTVNLDDDANSAYSRQETQERGISDERLSELMEWLENAKDREELEKLFRVGYSEAKKLGDQNAMKAIISKKDKEKGRF